MTKVATFIHTPWKAFPTAKPNETLVLQPRDMRVTCRETGDRYSIIYVGSGYRCYCNESYQVFRKTRKEALDWIQSEANISLG
jgi:hypothetical protein